MLLNLKYFWFIGSVVLIDLEHTFIIMLLPFFSFETAHLDNNLEPSTSGNVLIKLFLTFHRFRDRISKSQLKKMHVGLYLYVLSEMVWQNF